jgi:hypothetical protein
VGLGKPSVFTELPAVEGGPKSGIRDRDRAVETDKTV